MFHQTRHNRFPTAKLHKARRRLEAVNDSLVHAIILDEEAVGINVFLFADLGHHGLEKLPIDLSVSKWSQRQVEHTGRRLGCLLFAGDESLPAG